MYHHRDFVHPTGFGQGETGFPDVDSRSRSLHIQHSNVGSHPLRRTNTDHTYAMGRNVDTRGPTPASARNMGNFSSASMQQGMVSASFEFPPVMEGDCFLPNGQGSSYPALGDLAYGASFGYTHTSPIGPFQNNTRLMLSSQGSMFDLSPVSSDSQMLSGDNYSPVSLLSTVSPQHLGGVNGDDPSSWSFIEAEPHTGLDIHHPGIGDSDWIARPEYPCVPHDTQAESANGEDEATQELSDDDIRCPDCSWAPHPHPSRTVKQRKQSVSKHRNRKHSGKVYCCPARDCRTTFTRTDNIRPHVRREHPEYDLGPVAPRKPGVGRRRSGNGSLSSII